MTLSKDPNVVAIIQARMQSTRLPGKALLPMAGKPALWWMINRALLAKLVDYVVVATTNNPENESIMNFADQNHKGLYAYAYNGEEDDVIGRVISCAKYYAADIIVDITGDCPMVDPRHIDYLVEILIDNSKLDYTSNDIVNRSWPDGLDIQVYWIDALMRCQRRFNPIQHCGYNIGLRNAHFNTHCWIAPAEYNWPELGLTLDTPEDYEILCRLFAKFSGFPNKPDPGFKAEDVIEFLRKNPDWITNKNVKRKTPEEG